MEKKQVLIFINGMWGSEWYWQKWINIAEQNGYICRSIIPQNCQRSGGTYVFGDYLTQVRKIINAIIKQFCDHKIILIGHSMGGLIAQKMAEEFELAGAVFVTSAQPRGILVMHWELLSRMWRYVPEMITGKLFIPRKKDVVDLMFSECEDSEGAYAQLIHESGHVALQLATFSVPVADKLKCPSLVVGGTLDQMTPLKVQQKIAYKYGSPLRIFKCGHFPMLEETGGYMFSNILNWIEEQK